MSASLKVAKSSALLFAIQIVQRGLGIISTLILARLLTPEDFGVVALVTIILQFFELLVETGNQQYIVQKDTVSNADLNTAWSMDILIKSSITVAIMACAPLLANFFDTPELVLALPVAALAIVIRAFRTPGMMVLAREINYRPMFRLTLWQKGLSFLTVIALALLHASYWAIIAGSLVSAVVLAIGSYRVHEFRPSWTLGNFREQWQFSRWLLLRGVVGFTRSQIDNLMVSRFFGTTSLGGYNLVREVSLLPALSAIIPMSEPLLASIAQVRHTPEALAYRIRLALAVMVTLLTPITTFLLLYPELTINVLLGPQWSAYSHLLQPFALFFFTFCLFALVSDAVIALGKVRALFTFDVLSTVVIVTILLLFATDTLGDMAWIRGWLAVATTFCLLGILNQWTAFGLWRLLWLSVPSILGSLGAAWLVSLPTWPALSGLWEFIFLGTLFVSAAALLIVGSGRILLSGTEEWAQLHSLVRQATRRTS
nr:lipopolysaccharide biosynthesis protein [uncultured Marinobacter sp.]